MAEQKHFIKSWWRRLKYDPSDPKYFNQIKVVAIGGGTGLSNLLKGIKHYTQEISAIVTVFDSGKSSGRLRSELNVIPPSDIRRCLLALSKNNGTLSEIFDYRFKSQEGGELNGHSFGNIWFAALEQYFGSFERAIEESSNLLDIIGHVYPVTLDKIDLVCEFKNGKKIVGEDKISEVSQPIKKIILSGRANAYEKSILAIKNADLIIFGPGSIYTSIIPNLLVAGITDAIKKNQQALKIFVNNVSTERGETEGLTAEDHIKLLIEYLKSKPDVALVNNHLIRKSKKVHDLGEVNNITTDKEEYLGVKIIKADVIDAKNPLFHDNEKLAKEIIACYNNKSGG